MNRQSEASNRPRRELRMPTALVSTLLALVLVPPACAVSVDTLRLEPTTSFPTPEARPAAARRVIVPRRLPPVAAKQAVSLPIEEINFLDVAPSTDVDLQLPSGAKSRMGGWVGIGFGPMSLD